MASASRSRLRSRTSRAVIHWISLFFFQHKLASRSDSYIPKCSPMSWLQLCEKFFSILDFFPQHFSLKTRGSRSKSSTKKLPVTTNDAPMAKLKLAAAS